MTTEESSEEQVVRVSIADAQTIALDVAISHRLNQPVPQWKQKIADEMEARRSRYSVESRRKLTELTTRRKVCLIIRAALNRL